MEEEEGMHAHTKVEQKIINKLYFPKDLLCVIIDIIILWYGGMMRYFPKQRCARLAS